MYSNYIFCFDISSIPSVHTTLFAKTLQGDTSMCICLHSIWAKHNTKAQQYTALFNWSTWLTRSCPLFALDLQRNGHLRPPALTKGQPLPRTLSSHFLLISKARRFPCRAFTNYIARNNARYPCRTCVLCVLGLISRSVGAGMLSRCRRYWRALWCSCLWVLVWVVCLTALAHGRLLF